MHRTLHGRTTGSIETSAAGQNCESLGVLLWSDTGQARTLNYRTMYGPRNEEIAAGTGRFVLNAVAEDPKSIPDP